MHRSTSCWASFHDLNTIQTIELAPAWSKAYSRRASALAAGGRLMGAVLAMRKSVDLEPHDENKARLRKYEADFSTLLSTCC